MLASYLHGHGMLFVGRTPEGILNYGAKKIGHLFCLVAQKISMLLLKCRERGQINFFQAYNEL